MPQPTINDVRKWWNSRPCNLKHSDAEVGTRIYFDECEAQKTLVEPHIAPFANYHEWAGRKVLEIGTGMGHDAVQFARAGADYHGLELSKKSLDLACRRFEIYGLKGKFFLWNAEDLSAIDFDGFDLIYSFGVIHHSPDPHRILVQAANRLAPNGEMRVMLYAKNSWKQMMIDAGYDQPEAQAGCPIAKSFTQEEADSLFWGAGLQVQEMTQTHIFPYVLDAYKRHEYELLPWIKAMPEEQFAVMQKCLGWHLLIKARKRY